MFKTKFLLILDKYNIGYLTVFNYRFLFTL